VPKVRANGGNELDAVDETIIRLLEDEARRPVADLARAVGMSPQSVGERIKRLEDRGVIIGFSVKLDPKRLGLGIGAYVRVRPMMGQLPRVAELIASMPEIVECDRITGEDCFIAKLFVADVEDLERVIDRLLPYAQTNTSVIQSSPVKRRLPRRM
jgi:Lrp/AsnC family leucine-responsive transcriptional regulator